MQMAVDKVIYSSRIYDIEVNGKPKNASWLNTTHQNNKQEWTSAWLFLIDKQNIVYNKRFIYILYL